jgi:hypothetical protein
LIPLYIRIPKTASKSIYKSLIEKYNYPKWATHHCLQTQLEEKCKYYNYNYDYVFTVVRNPYIRMISAYTFHKYFYKKKIKQYNIPNIKFFENEYRYANIDFKDYIKFYLYEATDLNFLDFYSHFLPQKTYINTDIEIFKFEQINKVEDKLSIKLSHFHNSNITNYIDYYDTTTINLVYNYYKEDFQRFEYDKNILSILH